MISNGLLRTKRSRNIYQPLVAAPAKTQALVPLLLPETSVHQHIYILQQLSLTWVGQQLLERIARVTPNVLTAFRLDGLRQFGKSFWLEHRVASAKRHIGERVIKYLIPLLSTKKWTCLKIK